MTGRFRGRIEALAADRLLVSNAEPPADNPRVDPADLGALLVVLHSADAPRGRVEVTYRVWRHQERLHAAFTANAQEQKRRGASIRSFGVGKSQP
jgi:hypothetical protein